jgi:uncharacterized membrane protein
MDKSDVAVGAVLAVVGLFLVLSGVAREWLAGAWAKQQQEFHRQFPRWPGSGALTSDSWRLFVMLIGGGLVFAGLLVIANAWE